MVSEGYLRSCTRFERVLRNHLRATPVDTRLAQTNVSKLVMNMIKTLTVVSVLVAASAAQAAVLFDSTGEISSPTLSTGTQTAAYQTILFNDSLATGEYQVFTITGLGNLSFVATDAVDSTATAALYANDALYTVAGKDYWGPGTMLEGSDFTFGTYQAGSEGQLSEVSMYTTALPLTYTDNAGNGISFGVTSADGLSLVFSQSDTITGTYYKDLWVNDSGVLTLKNTALGKPLAFEVDGTVTVVPEAGTLTLAFMGIAALCGFAGLRRVKRD